MKKCFVMFVFFVVMLLIAVITDKDEAVISEKSEIGYADTEARTNNKQSSDAKAAE